MSFLNMIGQSAKRLLILGAAGRDFHNFNVLYRDSSSVRVMGFTATQIPGIAGRQYPPELAGSLYPNGIPILEEKDLEDIISREMIDECVLSYSDLAYPTVMRLASRVNAAGSRFVMLDAQSTMLPSVKPVVAVVAVRTGCGKSQTTRRVVEILHEAGLRVASIRHPMPYGDLAAQKVQRFASLKDLTDHDCTIEEMEEYEPHIKMGSVIYAGVDYAEILRQAEQEADVIVWDGGNNDTSFIRPNMTIVVADPLRAGHEIAYYPGEINLRLADVVVVNKMDSATRQQFRQVRENARAVNPKTAIIQAESTLTVDDPSVIAGKSCLVIEDGPTLTHGGMKTGAGTVAAQRGGASRLVDPRSDAVGEIAQTFRDYPDIGTLLPAMGYGDAQIRDLEATINAVDCDSVVIGTPIDLARFVRIGKPHTRVRYDLSADAKEELCKLLFLEGII